MSILYGLNVEKRTKNSSYETGTTKNRYQKPADITEKIIFIYKTFFRYLFYLRWVSKYSPIPMYVCISGYFLLLTYSVPLDSHLHY